MHVWDEAAHDFLSYYNSTVLARYGHFSWLPRMVMQFRTWLAALLVGESGAAGAYEVGLSKREACGRWRMCSRESPSAEWNRAHPGGNSRAHRAVGAVCRAGARSVHSSVANRSSCVPDLRLAEEPRTPGEFSVPRTGSDPGPGRRLPRDDAARWYLRWGAFRSVGVRPIVW